MPIATDIPSSSPSWLVNAPKGHLTLQLMTGSTAAFTCRKFPLASYYLHIPAIHPLSRQLVGLSPERGSVSLPVVVVVHGSGRDAARERDNYIKFAEEHGCVVVAPLFPCDLGTVDGVDNYKRLAYQRSGEKDTLYFDTIMLEILDEVSEIWGSVDITRVSMTGFSGGGQFVHRFLYLHPDRLRSASVGAPGNATYLDESLPWPAGTQNVSSLFRGQLIDLDQLKLVPIQLFVGLADIYHTINYDGTPAKHSRYDVIKKLSENFSAFGIPHTFDTEEGVAHEGNKLLHFIQPFILKHLRS